MHGRPAGTIEKQAGDSPELQLAQLQRAQLADSDSILPEKASLACSGKTMSGPFSSGLSLPGTPVQVQWQLLAEQQQWQLQGHHCASSPHCCFAMAV